MYTCIFKYIHLLGDKGTSVPPKPQLTGNAEEETSRVLLWMLLPHQVASCQGKVLLGQVCGASTEPSSQTRRSAKLAQDQTLCRDKGERTKKGHHTWGAVTDCRHDPPWSNWPRSRIVQRLGGGIAHQFDQDLQRRSGTVQRGIGEKSHGQSFWVGKERSLVWKRAGSLHENGAQEDCLDLQWLECKETRLHCNSLLPGLGVQHVPARPTVEALESGTSIYEVSAGVHPVFEDREENHPSPYVQLGPSLDMCLEPAKHIFILFTKV